MKKHFTTLWVASLWLMLLTNASHAQPSPVATLEHNLDLSASIPETLQVLDSEVIWHIHSLSGGDNQTLQGRHVPLTVPEGKYEVGLQVGAYAEQATIEVASGKLASPRFKANIGRLKASSSALVDWVVYEKNVAFTAPRQIMQRQASSQISTLVAAGEYDLVATLNNASQHQTVHIARGSMVDTSLEVPTGKVNLVATLGNAPAMRPMSWKIYRLDDKRQEVSTVSRRHSATLNVTPGRYEAVANLDGRERHREFTVMDGTSSSVVLAMD